MDITQRGRRRGQPRGGYGWLWLADVRSLPDYRQAGLRLAGVSKDAGLADEGEDELEGEEQDGG